MSAIYSLEEIVDEYIHDLPASQKTEREYDRMLSFALRGLRELRIRITKDGIKRYKASPNALNRISFPDDMETFVALYVPVNGKMWRLTGDRDIIVTKTVIGEGAAEELDTDYGEGVDQPTAQFDNFRAVGAVNLEGYYNVDYENREIVINNNRKEEVVVEYTWLGMTEIIPSLYVPALQNFMYYKSIERDMSVNQAEKFRAKKEYTDSLDQIKIDEGPSLQEWIDTWNKKSRLR